MKTLLTLTLALVCIFTGSAYFFTTNNMLMFEVLISAIPSFVLSLQPNTNRVKGKFISFRREPCHAGSADDGVRDTHHLYHQSNLPRLDF